MWRPAPPSQLLWLPACLLPWPGAPDTHTHTQLVAFKALLRDTFACTAHPHTHTHTHTCLRLSHVSRSSMVRFMLAAAEVRRGRGDTWGLEGLPACRHHAHTHTHTQTCSLARACACTHVQAEEQSLCADSRASGHASRMWGSLSYLCLRFSFLFYQRRLA